MKRTAVWPFVCGRTRWPSQKHGCPMTSWVINMTAGNKEATLLACHRARLLKEKNSPSLSLSVSFCHVKINETNISQSACLIVFCFENWEGEPPQNNHTHKESVEIQTKNNVSKIHSHTWRQYLHFRHQLFYSKATHNCNFKSQGRELNWHSEEIGKIQMNNNIVSSCHADCKKEK